MSDRSEIEWSPRVSLAKIRALYENEARGTCDDELIEEIGFGLLARCRSILEFTAACEEGKVRCMRCAKQGQTTIISAQPEQASALLRCRPADGRCAGGFLKPNPKFGRAASRRHAGEAFTRYVAVYPQCRTREEKNPRHRPADPRVPLDPGEGGPAGQGQEKTAGVNLAEPELSARCSGCSTS